MGELTPGAYDDRGGTYHYYKIITKIDINIPILNNVFGRLQVFQITGDTKVMKIEYGKVVDIKPNLMGLTNVTAKIPVGDQILELIIDREDIKFNIMNLSGNTKSFAQKDF